MSKRKSREERRSIVNKESANVAGANQWKIAVKARNSFLLLGSNLQPAKTPQKCKKKKKGRLRCSKAMPRLSDKCVLWFGLVNKVAPPAWFSFTHALSLPHSSDSH